MKKVVVCFALLALLALSGQAFAAQCTIDAVPAATLLLPYFEVDFNDTNGVTTLFSINNASATAVLAHVTLWTDESIPTLDFDVYLTGYDVQTINIRDIFNGNLPVTAPRARIRRIRSARRVRSRRTSTSRAAPASPVHNPALDDFLLPHVQAAHTGELSGCTAAALGARYGDNIARGYITVDVTNSCSTAFPDARGLLHSGGSGTATNQNVLWGDYFYVNPANNFAQGETSSTSRPVGLAEPAPPRPAGDYTFYGRYVNGTGVDNREPLATTLATRYVQGGPSTAAPTCWSGATRCAPPARPPTPAARTSRGVPLPQTEVVGFDEQEHATLLCLTTGPPVSPPLPGTRTCFPRETGATAWPSSNVPGADPTNPPYDFGWLYLNLNFTYAGSPYCLDQNIAQSWVVTLMKAAGRFSVGMDAIPLSSACSDSNVIIGG